MIREIFMPALSSTMTEGKIVSWAKSPGERVSKGETVLVVESDKADMDVEAFYDGYLAAIVVESGGTAPVGSAIAYLAESESEIEAAQQQAQQADGATPASSAPAADAPAPPASEPPAPAAPPLAPVTADAPAAPPATPSAPQRNGRTVASPRARKLAKERGVDLAAIRGSGPHGRIVAADIEAATEQTAATAAPVPAPAPQAPPLPAAAPTTPAPAPPPAAPGEFVPFTTLQNAVVRNMMASLQVPVFRVSYVIATDRLDALYKQVKSKGVTMTALLAKAVAVTLAKHPLLNASFAETGIQHSSRINIAVAVAMEDGGLITPVLQNADAVDLYSLSRTWKDLVARSRSKQLQPEEYSSGTFTLSNLGMYGVDRFDAILPPGTGSILAIGGSRPQLVANDDGSFAVKRQMTVNITCDHRIIYGADAAAFLKDLATLIETDPQSLTL